MSAEFVDPDKVARSVLSAIDDDRTVVVVGAEAPVARLVARVTPRIERRFARLELSPGAMWALLPSRGKRHRAHPASPE